MQVTEITKLTHNASSSTPTLSSRNTSHKRTFTDMVMEISAGDLMWEVEASIQRDSGQNIMVPDAPKFIPLQSI